MCLKTIVLEVEYSTYIFSLHNVFTVYMGSLTKDTTNNTMAQYGQIAASDIEQKKNLQELLGKSQPIDFFFKIIYDGVGYDSEANTPF